MISSRIDLAVTLSPYEALFYFSKHNIVILKTVMSVTKAVIAELFPKVKRKNNKRVRCSLVEGGMKQLVHLTDDLRIERER